MDLTAPASAFQPFFTVPTTIQSSTGRSDLATPIHVQAQVLSCDPYDIKNGIGDSNTDVTWTVAFPRSAITELPKVCCVVMVEGCPRMSIKSVHCNGPLVHLECTSLSRGK